MLALSENETSTDLKQNLQPDINCYRQRISQDLSRSSLWELTEV